MNDHSIAECRCFSCRDAVIQSLLPFGKYAPSKWVGCEQTISSGVPVGRIANVLRMIANHEGNFLIVDGSVQVQPSSACRPHCVIFDPFAASVASGYSLCAHGSHGP